MVSESFPSVTPLHALHQQSSEPSLVVRCRVSRSTMGHADAVASRPDLDLHYRVDDFTDPWSEPETVLMLHGNAESSAAWYGWVPHAGAPLPSGAPGHAGLWRLDADAARFPLDAGSCIIDDYCRLMDHLGVERFHLVGAKIGGTIARAFAARRPERVRTLTVVGTPPPLRAGAAERVPALVEMFEQHGRRALGARRAWAAVSGSTFPPEGVEWWTKFMGRTAVSTQIGFMETIACADIRADVPKIACPTLVITTEGSGLASVEETRAWQETIPDSELLVLPGQLVPRRGDRRRSAAPRRPWRLSSGRDPAT